MRLILDARCVKLVVIQKLFIQKWCSRPLHISHRGVCERTAAREGSDGRCRRFCAVKPAAVTANYGFQLTKISAFLFR